MNRVLTSLLRGVASQMHPAMLALLIVPFLVAIVFWVLAAWFVWDPLIDWLRVSIFESTGVMRWIVDLSSQFGMEGLRGFLSVVIALMLLVPLAFVTAVVLIAVLAMPLVNRHLGNGPYRMVARAGSWSVAASVWNAVSSLLVFIVGYLLTLPLWFIPPLALIVPWLWWSWLTARVLRFDSLVEHASVEERKRAIASQRGRYFLLAMAVTALNYIPPLFLITPVLSALMFGHFSLSWLRDERARAGPPAQGDAPRLPTG